MSGVPFYKAVSGGNDFVIVDVRRKPLPNAKNIARDVCDRHFGIGADGLMLFEKSKKADFRMRIYNADGSEAEMCGNGLQCIVLYAHEILKFPKQVTVETMAGIQTGAIQSKNRVSVGLVNPHDFRSESPLSINGKEHPFFFLNTGVPHAVLYTEQLEEAPVETLGAQIRFHPHFKPAGTNVNFVKVTSRSGISIRTYERGVEHETLACGTGVTASAIISALEGLVKAPVSVKTKSGETFQVSFNHDRYHVTGVKLEGQPRLTFSGVWHV
jgi:diaminopimelate epimerase